MSANHNNLEATGQHRAIKPPGLLATLSNLKAKTPTKAAFATLKPPVEDFLFTLSPEAKKLLDEKREAEKREAEKEKIQKSLDTMRARSAALEEIKKNKARSDLQRIGEIKERLKVLVGMIRLALMMGDKQAAARIAKEAANLAKDLKRLLKGNGSKGGADAPSVPNVVNSGNGAEPVGEASNAAGEGADMAVPKGAEDDSGGAEGLETDAETAGAEGAAEDALGEAAATQTRADEDETGDGENEGRQKPSDAARAKALMDIYSEKGQEAKEAQAKRELIMEIVAYLKTIAAMAKATVQQKDPILKGAPLNPQSDAKAAKEVEKAVSEIEEAIGDLAAA